jgi:hypothetical protein
MFVYLAERTRDEDGSGWAFWRFDIEPSVLEAYEEAVIVWERARAVAINGILTLCGIPGGREDGACTRAVNSHMFDSTADKMPDVVAAYAVMSRRLHWVSEEIAALADKYGSRPSISECDVVGEREFRSRYLPLIQSADEANERAINDPMSHHNYLIDNGYTSIFNGR